MQSRRQTCSSVCLLLFLGLLCPPSDCSASYTSNDVLQQARPTAGSSGSLRTLKGTAFLGNAAKYSVQSLVASAPEAVHTPSQALPNEEQQEARPPGASQGAAWRGANLVRDLGLLQPSARAGSPEATLLRGVAWGPGRSGRAVHHRSLAQAPMLNTVGFEGEAFVPAPAPDLAAYLLVVMEMHGVNIQPFGYQDRLDFLVSLDDAIDDINLDNIELLAVEEFLPASGPSAESLMNLFGTNSVFKSPKASSGNAPPPAGALAAIKLAGQPASPLASVARASGRRRHLLQNSTGQLAPPAVLTEPVVRVTLRISTTVMLVDKVEQELQRSMLNTTKGLAARLRDKGHDVTGIYIVSMTSSLAPIGGPSIAPSGAVTMPPSGPLDGSQTTIVRTNKSGTASINSSDSQSDKNTNGTTIGVSIGVGVPVLLGTAGVAIYLLVFRRRQDLQQGAKAAKSRHWGGDTPDPWGFLMSAQANNQFKNPLYPLPKEPPKPSENGVKRSSDSQLLEAYVAAANGSKGRDSPEGSSNGNAAAERDGGGSASVSGKEWGEGAELVNYSDLKFSRVIGEGSFGRVFLGKWRETTVAIKLLSQPLVPPSTGNNWDFGDGSGSFTMVDCDRHKRNAKVASLLEELRKEARLMAVLRHPNIVMFLGACSSPPCMVTEFCARGSLLDILSRARDNPAAAAELGWNRRLNMALEAAKGMLYLHSRAEPVLHRDLKSANLLVDKHWRVKVADFNLSRVMNASAVVSSVSATNPRWMAPEVLAGKSYDCAADVFSFGIILWELLTWHIPWEDLGPWQVVILVVDQGQRPELPADPAQLPGKPLRHISTYLDLMCHCWHQDPAQRPTFERVISHLRALIEAEGQATAAPREVTPQLPAAQEPQPAKVASADSPSAS